MEEIPAFLERIREGRPYSEELLTEVREKYRSAGDASPLPAITHRTAEKLEAACGLPVFVGMLHSAPYLEDTVGRMVSDGISSALVICLAPHFSETSVGRYHHRATAAADGTSMTLDLVDSWHTVPAYIEGLADSVASSWTELGLPREVSTHVIFSAHSLPKTALPDGDPYERQLQETAELVARRLGLPEDGWTVAYQGAAGSGQGWLGPSVYDTMLGLAARGENQVVLCPCGSVTDQVEILHDLDLVMKQKAVEAGLILARSPLLNDGPALIDSLTLLVDRWRG